MSNLCKMESEPSILATWGAKITNFSSRYRFAPLGVNLGSCCELGTYDDVVKAFRGLGKLQILFIEFW